MDRIKFFCIFLVLAGTISAFALNISIVLPEFDDPDLNDALRDAFELIEDDLYDQVGSINSKPENFIQAWGNSAVFASQGATQRGYAGYKYLAVTFGPMIGIQLPTSPFRILDELNGFENKLNAESDYKLGFSPQILAGQIGINTSKFFINNFYLGFRFGYINLDNDFMQKFPSDFGTLSFRNWSVGLMANYQLVSQKKAPAGIFVWRGISLGTGFIFQYTKLNYVLELDTITQDIPPDASYGSPEVYIDPKLSLGMEITTFTFPFEVTTSVRLLYFLNLSVGAGVDVGIGISKMRIGMDADIGIKGVDPLLTQTNEGNISVFAGGNMAPNMFNLKVMTGLGITLGPVVIDIPVSYYFLDNGFSFGVTLGVVW